MWKANGTMVSDIIKIKPPPPLSNIWPKKKGGVFVQLQILEKTRGGVFVWLSEFGLRRGGGFCFNHFSTKVLGYEGKKGKKFSWRLRRQFT